MTDHEGNRPSAGADGAALSRDVISAKALELADAEGLENVSVRKLASALGRTPMALYRHFGSMDEIKAGVVALAFKEVDVAAVPGERWDDTLRRTTSSIRQMHLRHRRAHLTYAEGDALDPGLCEHTERVQKLHHDQGIPDDVLSRAWRIVDAFLTGFIANEIYEIERSDHHLSDGDRPAWFETAEGAYSEQSFRDGIEIIIAGIRGIAAPDPCEWRTPLQSGHPQRSDSDG